MEKNITSTIRNKSELLFEKVKGYREFMHKYPELSYQEKNVLQYFGNLFSLYYDKFKFILTLLFWLTNHKE